MKFLVVLTFCLIGVSNAAKDTHKFKYENCQKGESIVTINEFSVSPDPISFSKNITATVNLELHEDIPEGAIAKIGVYKVTSLFGVKLPAPCINGIGSCTLDYCKVLDTFRDQACPFFPEGVECDCNLKKNTFGGVNVTVAMPELGPLIKFIASGYYRVEARVLDSNKKQIACYAFTGKAVP